MSRLGETLGTRLWLPAIVRKPYAKKTASQLWQYKKVQMILGYFWYSLTVFR